MPGNRQFRRPHRNRDHAQQRRKPVRAPYAKVLIVCEGEKTEPFYFNSLRDYYRLSSTNIEVTGESGSSPLDVFNFAKHRYNEEKKAGDPFDKVYCVFDKDNHDSYQQALDRIQRARPSKTYVAIPSVPCFEYWLLLHFTYLTRPYMPLDGNSASNQVLADLLGHYPEYRKGLDGVFEELFGNLEDAKSNASRGLIQAQEADTDNPSTYVHVLVEYLQHIKQPLVP